MVINKKTLKNSENKNKGKTIEKSKKLHQSSKMRQVYQKQKLILKIGRGNLLERKK